MLHLGRLRPSHDPRISRRSLLQAGSLGVAGITLADLLRVQAHAADGEARPPAKSIILLWLWGGPSHLDTFDLKPRSPTEYRGPYAPIATNVPGIEICELLPRLARRADKYAILRSLHCETNDHGLAGTVGLTGAIDGGLSLGGQDSPGQLNPTHGSIVSRHLGFSPDLPRFCTIGERLQQGHKPIRGETSGVLGAVHDPFRLNYSLSGGVELPSLTLSDGISPSGLESRSRLWQQLDGALAEIDRTNMMSRMDEFYQQAFALLTSQKSREVFDLDREPETTRRAYGQFRFGQCCLLARRLVQAGARFVQVNWSTHVEPVEDTGDGGWDMHDRYFQQYQDRHAWMLDQALSALLDDLESCGLLNETIVIALGEFGRTPKINEKSGRDHWNDCYSGLIAGGGTRGGQVVGSSDPLGEYPASRPMTPADLFATAFANMGIGTPELTEMNLLPRGEFVEELS